MTIEQAKTIPLSLVLEKVKLASQRNNLNKIIDFLDTPSPRLEALKLQEPDGEGINTVRVHLHLAGESSEVADAVRWINTMTNPAPPIQAVYDPEEKPTSKSLKIRLIKPLQNEKLIEFGVRRGIPFDILNKHFEEATVGNSETRKKFYALCMRNESNGYDLRTPFFKGCIGRSYITFIRGTLPKPSAINIFKGIFDYLSVLALEEGKPLKHDCLIMHTHANLRKASAYVQNYGYEKCFTWMDNTPPGIAATNSWAEFCRKEPGLKHIPMNSLYEPHKDVNAGYMAMQRLKNND